jgi:hypothetical protein
MAALSDTIAEYPWLRPFPPKQMRSFVPYLAAASRAWVVVGYQVYQGYQGHQDYQDYQGYQGHQRYQVYHMYHGH